MMTFRPMRAGSAWVRVLVCLVSAILLVWLPVIHHHQVPVKGGSEMPADQSCTLCATLTGMDVNGSIPAVDAPFLSTPCQSHNADPLICLGSTSSVDGRAPPTQTV